MTGAFLGQAILDIQFVIDEYPKQNKVTHAKDRIIDIGGPAANAAITFSYLGGRGTLIAPLGMSSLSTWVKEQLAQYNVDVIDTNSQRQTPLTISTVLTTISDGDRTIINKHYAQSDVDFEFKEELLTGIDILLVDFTDINLAVAAVENANKSGIPVVLDADGWREGIERILFKSDILILSENFIGFKKNDVINFINKFSVKRLAITRGNLPILGFEMGIFFEVPIKKVEVVDSLGAGDILHGAFCYYYSIERSFKQALNLASVIATKSCGYLGVRGWMN